MQILSTEQLAQLLVGIARTQAAILQGMESKTEVIQALEALAHRRDRPQPTLADLPARILLASLTRTGPDVTSLAQELERLCGSGGRPTDFNP
jgi:hypothetical protein